MLAVITKKQPSNDAFARQVNAQRLDDFLKTPIELVRVDIARIRLAALRESFDGIATACGNSANYGVANDNDVHASA